MAEIKDSGQREAFDTGSVRDTNEGKLRPDLLPCTCRFYEAAHFALGSIKYGPNNWKLGQPIMRFFESLERHQLLWALGDTSEDHLRGVRWNTMGIQHTLLMIEHGLLPKELDDRPPEMRPDNPVGKALLAQWKADSEAAIAKKAAADSGVFNMKLGEVVAVSEGPKKFVIRYEILGVKGGKQYECSVLANSYEEAVGLYWGGYDDEPYYSCEFPLDAVQYNRRFTTVDGKKFEEWEEVSRRVAQQCPHCGRDNSEYEGACTSDDCPDSAKPSVEEVRYAPCHACGQRTDEHGVCTSKACLGVLRGSIDKIKTPVYKC